jgi:hypothetical protein
MSEQLAGTSADRNKRAVLAGAIALSCAEAYIIASSRVACRDLLSMFLSAAELQILVPVIGLSVLSFAISTAIFVRLEPRSWLRIAVLSITFVVLLGLMLNTVTIVSGDKRWIPEVILSSLGAGGLIGGISQRLSSVGTALAGLLAILACFCITYVLSPYSAYGGPCGFAP